MKLTKEVKDLIRQEYNTFKEKMYAGKSKEERDELAQFFTPPEISIKLIEELTDLTGNVLDPTCGSGNLLAAAIIAGTDSDKVFGNDYDYTMVNLCRDRLNAVCDLMNKPHIQDWQVHQGNALIKDCLTEFSETYNETILAELLKRRNNMHGGYMNNPDKWQEFKNDSKKFSKDRLEQEQKNAALLAQSKAATTEQSKNSEVSKYTDIADLGFGI